MGQRGRGARMGTEDIEWLSSAEAAELLGVGVRTLYRLIDAGDIPAYRIGRVIRLQRSQVLEAIEQLRVAPAREDLG